jgi:hypothetical protein
MLVLGKADSIRRIQFEDTVALEFGVCRPHNNQVRALCCMLQSVTVDEMRGGQR